MIDSQREAPHSVSLATFIQTQAITVFLIELCEEPPKDMIRSAHRLGVKTVKDAVARMNLLGGCGNSCDLECRLAVHRGWCEEKAVKVAARVHVILVWNSPCGIAYPNRALKDSLHDRLKPREGSLSSWAMASWKNLGKARSRVPGGHSRASSKSSGTVGQRDLLEWRRLVLDGSNLLDRQSYKATSNS
ncbi:MAG: hypothetical protein M2R46_02486 [Verrucomicrobia subdivision 3 bacterium]|nr:hypothetical protein [Limisphaerales bacterium]